MCEEVFLSMKLRFATFIGRYQWCEVLSSFTSPKIMSLKQISTPDNKRANRFWKRLTDIEVPNHSFKNMSAMCAVLEYLALNYLNLNKGA